MDTREAVGRVYRHLGGDVDARARVSAAATASDDVLTFDRGIGQITGDAVLQLPNGERCYVWEVDEDAGEATVERGFAGEAAESVESGDIVRVNPRWPYTDVTAALTEEAGGLTAEGLFVMETVDLEYDFLLGGLDIESLRDDMIDGFPYGIEHAWGGQRYWLRDWTVDQTLLRVPSFQNGTFTVYYRAAFPEFPAADVDDWDADLERVAEILTLGAAMRLQADAATGRMDHRSYQGVRGGEELPHSGPIDAASVLQSRRQTQVDLELSRQTRLWPLRTR